MDSVGDGKGLERKPSGRLVETESVLPPGEGALPACPAPRPAPGRGRRGVLPLIAYTATGSYVVICPSKGELPLLPDSPAWFDWLATLSSFRFVGQRGRLSTYRNKGRSCWMAYRRIHGRRYEYALGRTDRLTINRLEQMAAKLQAHLASL